MDVGRRRCQRKRRLATVLVLAGGLALCWASLPAWAGEALATASSPAQPRYAGRPLEGVLRDLRARGLRLVYSSRVVGPEMRVEEEPSAAIADDPRAVLEAILASFGLTVRSGPGGLLVIVARPARPSPPPQQEERGTAEPAPGVPVSTFREEIVVTPSRFSLLGARSASRIGLGRDEILALPHLGDDLARALAVAPGVATSDVSARFQVRGGYRDETGLVLDGQELFDAFHLRDFDGALSMVAPAVLSSAELAAGTSPADPGGRLSGALEMTSLAPAGPVRARIGAGILGFQLGGGGALPRQLGGWLAEVRRGTGDLLGRLLKVEDPEYWDAFGKVALDLGARHTLRANLLLSSDRLSFAAVGGGETKRWLTDYDDSYLWLTHQALAGSALLLESAVSSNRFHRDRQGREEEDESRFAIRDRRDSEVRELRQRWSFALGSAHDVEAGWQLREAETDYDYAATRRFESPLARLRHDFGRESTRFSGRFRTRERSLYLSDTVRLQEALTLRLGVRHDRFPLTGEAPWSPRLDLAYAPQQRTVLRLGWGLSHQSQRTSELQVEDGETSFHRGERAEQRVLGLDRSFAGRGPFRAWDLRLELYQRRVAHPRPRYVNLFEPLNVFPEIELDRVRLAPSSSHARGVELFLRGGLGTRARASAGYTWAETTDRLAGRDVPRLFDQRHAVHLDLDLPAGPHWRLNLAWRWHTGWPTTPLSLTTLPDEEGEDELVPQLGRLNSRRLPPYHRLDLRASRRLALRRGTFEIYFDVQNLYGRRNVGGFDYEIDEERGRLNRRPERWPGLLPSFGVTLEL